jgi:hypothetical protein
MKILLVTSLKTEGTEAWGKTNNTAKRKLFETKNVTGYTERHID